jgi:uncharacterized membrane protein
MQISDRDKGLAAAVNVSAIFFPYMGPIVGAIVGAKSPYVKFHAYRNLIEQVISTIIIGFLMACSLAYSIYSLYNDQKDGFDLAKIDWLPILMKAAITWLLLAIWNLINIFLSLRDASQALKGKLPTNPKWSERRALKLAGATKLALDRP